MGIHALPIEYIKLFSKLAALRNLKVDFDPNAQLSSPHCDLIKVINSLPITPETLHINGVYTPYSAANKPWCLLYPLLVGKVKHLTIGTHLPIAPGEYGRKPTWEEISNCELHTTAAPSRGSLPDEPAILRSAFALNVGLTLTSACFHIYLPINLKKLFTCLPNLEHLGLYTMSGYSGLGTLWKGWGHANKLLPRLTSLECKGWEPEGTVFLGSKEEEVKKDNENKDTSIPSSDGACYSYSEDEKQLLSRIKSLTLRDSLGMESYEQAEYLCAHLNSLTRLRLNNCRILTLLFTTSDDPTTKRGQSSRRKQRKRGKLTHYEDIINETDEVVSTKNTTQHISSYFKQSEDAWDDIGVAQTDAELDVPQNRLNEEKVGIKKPKLKTLYPHFQILHVTELTIGFDIGNTLRYSRIVDHPYFAKLLRIPEIFPSLSTLILDKNFRSIAIPDEHHLLTRGYECDPKFPPHNKKATEGKICAVCASLQQKHDIKEQKYIDFLTVTFEAFGITVIYQ